jgi:hypothetical protein
MPQFTKGDLPYLKDAVRRIVSGTLAGMFDFSKYIERKLITAEEKAIVIAYVKSHYPACPLDPVPRELRPLIRIAQDMLIETNKRWSMQPLPKPKKYTSSYAFYSYENDVLNDEYNYDYNRRH